MKHYIIETTATGGINYLTRKTTHSGFSTTDNLEFAYSYENGNDAALIAAMASKELGKQLIVMIRRIDVLDEAKHYTKRWDYCCYEVGSAAYALEDYINDIRLCGYKPVMNHLPDVDGYQPLPADQLMAIAHERVNSLLRTAESDWGSDEQVEAENNLMFYVEHHFGYDWEADEKATFYFAKATSDEILKYYRDIILPSLNK